jgi:dihydrodipicolinate synthase/N-acetylneuraminate lyase
VKYGTELTGLQRGDARPPLLPLTEAEKTHFRSLFDQLKSANLPGLVA